MKILFLSDNFPPERNAAATRVYERACYWVKWGHHVTVITSAPNFPEGKLFPGYKNRWYHKEYIDGIEVIRVKTFIHPNFGFFLRILDFLSYMVMAFFVGIFQKKPDVIVATSPQFFTAVAGFLLAVVKRKPFVFELGDLWPASIIAVGAMKHSFLLRVMEKLELFLYRRATAVVALTKSFKDDLVSRGIAADKIKVIINGVDLKRYTPGGKDTELVKQYKLENSFVVGYIGTHGMAQGLNNVIEAAIKLRDNKHIKFMFVGSGAEKEQLVARANDAELENVIFVVSQPKEKIVDFWCLCDVALVHLKDSPIFSTVIPSKIFEAMGMGLPILLVAPDGEAKDILVNAKAGVWVAAGNAAALAQQVLKLSDDTAKCEYYAKQSHLAAPRYSRERQAQEMLAVLNGVKK